MKRLCSLLLCSAFLTIGCHPSLSPPPVPTTFVFDVVLCSMAGLREADIIPPMADCPRISPGHVRVNTAPDQYLDGDVDAVGYVQFTVPVSLQDSFLLLTAPGYLPRVISNFHPPYCANGCHNFEFLTPEPPVDPLPPPPTRSQILYAPSWFQGITVETHAYGSLPLFDVAISSFDAADRHAAYMAHQAVGSAVISLAVSWNYAEPGQPYGTGNLVPPTDLTTDLPRLRSLVQEAIQEGFYVRLHLAGDGQSPVGGGYSDPGGWTYGYRQMMTYLPSIVSTLRQTPDLTPYIIFVPGFDGIITYDERTQTFGPWTIDQLNTYLVTLRSLVPNGYSAVEPSTGPLGGTLANFLSLDARDALDQILNEFDGPPWGTDRTWQIADRALGPLFVRPPDMPPNDDPNCPRACAWSLRKPTSRGPIAPVAFEYDLYRWVRRRVDLNGIHAQRAYLKVLGYPVVN